MTAPATLSLTPLRGDEDPEAFAAALASAHHGDEAAPRALLEQTRLFLAAVPRPDPWGSYLASDGARPVGSCAFKSAPDAEGAVEIAYTTFAAHENRGYAKAMIALLVALAGRSGAQTVHALTLPDDNPSNRALRSQGFVFSGEVVDPEDGPVWRWTRTPSDFAYALRPARRAPTTSGANASAMPVMSAARSPISASPAQKPRP